MLFNIGDKVKAPRYDTSSDPWWQDMLVEILHREGGISCRDNRTGLLGAFSPKELELLCEDVSYIPEDWS